MASDERSKIELVGITPENYDGALALSVREDQKAFVAPVQKSLADAYVYPQALFRLAVMEGVLIGYLLLYPFDSERGRTVNIVRLMIDQRFQGQGLGRRLLEAAIDMIRSMQPKVELVRVSTLPDNHAALHLYSSAGFLRAGMQAEEVVLYLELEAEKDRD